VGRDGLTKMTKVEVVVRGSDAAAVRDLLTSSGATGFTTISNVSGMGHHGYTQGRLLFNEESALDLLIAVVPDERAEAVIAGLRVHFENRPGVMFVSDSYVSRPEYFE
jgi:nitrogen regulatory protein PII